MRAPSTRSVIAAILVPALLAGDALGVVTEFTVLTINVAGLPAIINGNDVPGSKEDNANTMGAKLAEYNYDIINMQEDFNYHAYIYATDNHPFRTATSGPALLGSGLNTIANFEWSGFSRVKWNTCSDASGSDCLTPKGFTYMRVLVSSSSSSADGTVAQYVDVYNLHTDAGTEDDDEVARNSNLAQVSAYMSEWSVGVPVMLFGDTNCRYTRLDDYIEIFDEEHGMADPWVDIVHGGTAPTVESVCDNPSLTNDCEIVDKVFYRGSPLAELTATDFNYESLKFLQEDGNILTDHNPVRVNFTLADSSSLRMSPLWGGPHGEAFSDVDTVTAAGSSKVSKIIFRGGSRLDSVGVVLADGTSLVHGGGGGSESSLALASNEYWTAARLCRGEKDGQTRNFYVKATTSAGNTVEAGGSTGDCFDFAAPAGWQIIGYVGRDGDEMDQISFLFAPQ